VPARVRDQDPAPLTPAQLSALAAAATRELLWGLREVRETVRTWRARAAAIPDPTLQRHALDALNDKRPLLDGAALFWTLPRARRPDLLRLLVTFQILANFHDHAGERAGHGCAEVAGSIRTLGAVLDVERPWGGYFAGSPPCDGGYLDALALACRSASARLPHYDVIRPILIEQTARAEVMDIDHDAGAADRPERLERFATARLADPPGMQWWEAAAGAPSMMSVMVALALAADEGTTAQELTHAANAYLWVGAVGSLLDNYIDQRDDLATGAHNYMAYYASPEDGLERVAALIERALHEVSSLPRGERHRVIVASMVAMYLTSDSARGAGFRSSTRMLAARSGTLTRALMPLLAGWRLAFREADA
jgi:tetraprenyl-beta-curcumene synthase